MKGGVFVSLYIPGRSHAVASTRDMVYLFELDSVRINEAEIRIGQQRFFDAVTQEGKCVVLTFNQLTDSLAFLYPLKCDMDDVRSKYMESIVSLCRNGSVNNCTIQGCQRFVKTHEDQSSEKTTEYNRSHKLVN